MYSLIAASYLRFHYYQDNGPHPNNFIRDNPKALIIYPEMRLKCYNYR